jgi:hypothetical protein
MIRQTLHRDKAVVVVEEEEALKHLSLQTGWLVQELLVKDLQAVQLLIFLVAVVAELVLSANPAQAADHEWVELE